MFLVTIDADKCSGCGECVENCPNGVLELADGVAQVTEEECLGCESCVEVCTTGAVTVQEL